MKIFLDVVVDPEITFFVYLYKTHTSYKVYKKRNNNAGRKLVTEQDK